MWPFVSGCTLNSTRSVARSGAARLFDEDRRYGAHDRARRMVRVRANPARCKEGTNTLPVKVLFLFYPLGGVLSVNAKKKRLLDVKWHTLAVPTFSSVDANYSRTGACARNTLSSSIHVVLRLPHGCRRSQHTPVLWFYSMLNALLAYRSLLKRFRFCMPKYGAISIGVALLRSYLFLLLLKQ